MIHVGLPACLAVTLALAGPLGAGLPSLYPALAQAADKGGVAQAPFQLQGPQTAENDEVIKPPAADVDPGMVVVPHDQGETMRIIHPPGEKQVQPR
jgi:hypothetical protein